jgi:NAD+ synthase (glutamine-hydrolysing)
MEYGYVRVAAAVPKVKVADCAYNVQEMENLIAQAEGKGVEILCFPELGVTAYTCGDLFMQQSLLEEAEMALIQIVNFSRSLDIISIIGLPLAVNGMLLNCAAVLQKGRILGIVPKCFLPNYKEFYEKRWFSSGLDVKSQTVRICGQQIPLSRNLIFHTPSCKFCVEICEDVWAPVPPSSSLSLKGAEITFNLSADNECIGKYSYLCNLLSQQSARCLSGYVFSSCGFGESTGDVVFAGKAMIYENGGLVAEGTRFSFSEQLVISEIDVERLRVERRMNTTFSTNMAHNEEPDPQVIDTELLVDKECILSRTINRHPFIPVSGKMEETCKEILSIQVEGLAKRILHTHAETVVVGVSGGLDSTLALLVCVRTFDKLGLSRKGIIGITMPGFGTTDRTYTNATDLMKSLGVTTREISIKEACEQHFEDIGQDLQVHDVTYENGQARERTQILMDAANQMKGFVVGTGDLSELALGWATYNGDHMSMYGVNTSIPKTLVKYLVTWAANDGLDESSHRTLMDIVNTPISPELVPANEDGTIAQQTEDLVGPYELHDFFLYYFLRFGFRPGKIFFLAQHAFGDQYTTAVVKKWLTVFYRRFFAQQFKRSCLPDGPKVGSCSLSPRGDWRMPSDADATVWLAECESL